MKKTYGKPDILFEDFSLCTSIAGDCGVETNTPQQWECAYVFDGLNIFTNEVLGCTSNGGYVPSNGEFNGVCYHVPIDGRNLFNS